MMEDEIENLIKEREKAYNLLYEVDNKINDKSKLYIKEFLKKNKKTFPLAIFSNISIEDNRNFFKIVKINFTRERLDLDLIGLFRESKNDFTIRLFSKNIVFYKDSIENLTNWESVLNKKQIKITTEYCQETKLLDFIWQNGYYNEKYEFVFLRP